MALELPILFGGALFTETIFSWPGMGRLFFRSAQRVDYAVLMGIVMINGRADHRFSTSWPTSSMPFSIPASATIEMLIPATEGLEGVVYVRSREYKDQS